MDDVPGHGHVQERALPADALAIDDVKLRHPEGRGHLVLDHLHLGAVANDLAAVFQLLAPAHVQAHGGVELQGAAAGGGLRVAVHHAHLFTQLVDENGNGPRLAHNARELAQGLGHQAGLQAHKAVAHLAVNLRLGHQRRHGVHHHHVQGPGAYQRLGNFQGLLAGVRLGDVQFVNVDSQLLGVGGVQGVFRVHKGADAALFLGLGHDVQRHRGFTGGFRAVDFDDAALGYAAHPQGQIQLQVTGGDDLHVLAGLLAQLHHGAFAILLVQVRQGMFQGLELFLLSALGNGCSVLFGGRGLFRSHGFFPPFHPLGRARSFPGSAPGYFSNLPACPFPPPGAGHSGRFSWSGCGCGRGSP